eukprot:11164048-Ditylum_brightwellii.AAC.1
MGSREDPYRNRDGRLSGMDKSSLHTENHIIICRKTNPLWRELQSILQSLGAKNAAAPGLMASIVHGLHTWRDDETIFPPQGILTACADAFHEQTHIGWSTALKGFLSSKWQIIQTEH